MRDDGASTPVIDWSCDVVTLFRRVNHTGTHVGTADPRLELLHCFGARARACHCHDVHVFDGEASSCLVSARPQGPLRS